MNKKPDPLWDEAFEWLCRQRRHAPHNADIWELRWSWNTECKMLYKAVTDEHYRLSPMLIARCKTSHSAIWSSRDALV